MAKLLKNYPNIALSQPEYGCRLDFDDIFGRCVPVSIEIGSGKATFLLNEARRHPEMNFLGIEWCNKIYRYSVDRIGRWGLENVRIIRADASVFIRAFVPDLSIECFHIYFPDPWPKKRHHKRRFISPANLEQMLRCLAVSGSIRIATDHLDYFEQIEKVMSDGRLKKVEFLPSCGAQEENGECAGTNFERKYLKEGRKIFVGAWEKI